MLQGYYESHYEKYCEEHRKRYYGRYDEKYYERYYEVLYGFHMVLIRCSYDCDMFYIVFIWSGCSVVFWYKERTHMNHG